MSIRSVIRDWLMKDAEKAKKGEYPQVIRDRAGVEKYDLPDMSTYEAQANLMAKVSYLFTAVSLTAQSAASQGGGAFRTWGERKRAIDNHPVEELLRNPNPLQTGLEFLKTYYAYFLLNGNSYWWLNCADEYSPPTELWNLPPSTIKPIPDERMGIKGYIYDPGNGQETIIPEWQICHFKDFHPSSFFVGMGRVEPVSSTILTDIATQKYMQNLYGMNNGRLPGIIAFRDFIGKETWEQIKADMQTAAAKSSYMLLRGVGQGGVDLLNAANTVKDMEIWQGREMTEKDIFNIIAPGLLVALSVNSTDSNSKNGNAIFASFTLWPLLRGTAEKITQKILPRYGPNLVWEYDDPRLRDRAMDLQALEKFMQVAKVNEIREALPDFGIAKALPILPEEDERGELFVTQIQANSGMPEPEPEPVTTPALPYQETQTPPLEDNSDDMEEDGSVTQTDNAMMQDLNRYERKALKRIGQKVDFESAVIPGGILRTISIKLSICANESEVRGVFASARDKLKASAVTNTDSLASLAAAINGYTALIRKSENG